MLDADSVFERLLREAANLVPKMSTPKLTAALKVSSALQQRITDTLAARLHQEQGATNPAESKALAVQGFQSLVRTPILSEDLMTDNTFLTPNDNHFVSRNVTTSNYGGLPFFSQFNQFAVSQRTATLVTITNPHGASLAGATVVGTLAPGTTLIQSQQQQTPSPPTEASQTHFSDPSAHPNCVAPNLNVITVTSNGAHQQCANTVNMSNANGHILSSNGGLDLKPDPVACLARAAAVGLNTSEALFTTSNSSADMASFGFTPFPALTPITAQPGTLGLPDSSSSNGGGGGGSSGIHVISATTVSSASCTEVTSVSTHQQLPPASAVTTTSSPATVGCGGGGTAGIPSSHSSPVMVVTSADVVGGKMGPYECRECGKEFRILRYLEKHRRIHTGEKPYQCCYCGRQFNDWPNMNRHKRIHTGERPYRCAVCAKTFSQPAVYNEHVKRHTGERPYICSVCSKGFPRSARLAVHMRVHTGERPYPCNSCDRRFSQPHHLAAHLRVHSGDRPFSCSKCDVSFACISNLRRHRKQVHPLTPPNPATTSVPSSVSAETQQQQHQALSNAPENKFAVRPTFSTSLSMPAESNSAETVSNDGAMVAGLIFTPACSSPASSSSSVSTAADLLTAVASSADNSGILTHSTINDSLLASAESALSSNRVQNSSLMDTSHLISTSEANSQQEHQQQQQCSVASADVLVSQRSSLVGLASPGKENLSTNSPSCATADQSGNGNHMLGDQSSALEASTGQFMFDSSTHQPVTEQTLGVSGDTTIYLNSIDVSAAAGAGTDLTHLSNSPGQTATLIPTSTRAIQFQHFGSMPVGQFSFAPTVSLSAAVDSKSHLFATNGTTALFSDSTASEVAGVGNPLACAKTVQICYSTMPSASVQPDHTTAILLPSGQVFTTNSGFVSAAPPLTSVALPDGQHRHSTLQQLSTGQLITAHCQPTAAMLLPFASSGFFTTTGGAAMDGGAAAAVAPTQIPSLITSGIAFSPAWPTPVTCTEAFQLSNVSPVTAAASHSPSETPSVQPTGASPHPAAAGTPLPSASPHALAPTPANNPNLEASPAALG